MSNTPETDAVRSGDLFGSFKAVPWEDGKYVITCNAGVIGRTIDERTAQWLPSWLNWAMAEAMTKLPNSVLNSTEIAAVKSKLAEAVSIARQGRYSAMDFIAVGKRLDAMDDYLANNVLNTKEAAK